MQVLIGKHERSYSCTVDANNSVKSIVMSGAGTGEIRAFETFDD